MITTGAVVLPMAIAMDPVAADGAATHVGVKTIGHPVQTGVEITAGPVDGAVVLDGTMDRAGAIDPEDRTSVVVMDSTGVVAMALRGVMIRAGITLHAGVMALVGEIALAGVMRRNIIRASLKTEWLHHLPALDLNKRVCPGSSNELRLFQRLRSFSHGKTQKTRTLKLYSQVQGDYPRAQVSFFLSVSSVANNLWN
jgi:hypothetical protein